MNWAFRPPQDGKFFGKRGNDAVQYQAVLFDFDYTLGDSTEPITIGFQTGFSEMGWPAPSKEQVRYTIGSTLEDGYTMLTGDTDPDRRREFYERFQDVVGQRAVDNGNLTMIQETRFFPGAIELLEQLKAAGVTTGIVSTKQGRIIQRIFAHQGHSDLLALVVGGENVSRPKPDPEGLLGALRTLELAPEQVLFCGDTVIDAKTAQAAGVDFCAVLNGTTPAADFNHFPHVHIAPDLYEFKQWFASK